MFSRGKLTGTPPLWALSPCQASGGPLQDVKLWIRVQSGRGGYGSRGHLSHRAVSPLCLSVHLVGRPEEGGGGSGKSRQAGGGSAAAAVPPGGRL